jgi:hypothetical protein
LVLCPHGPWYRHIVIHIMCPVVQLLKPSVRPVLFVIVDVLYEKHKWLVHKLC